MGNVPFSSTQKECKKKVLITCGVNFLIPSLVGKDSTDKSIKWTVKKFRIIRQIKKEKEKQRHNKKS